eukprot:scaffold63541_cov19-Tisochrysis_lutea.AAC.1
MGVLATCSHQGVPGLAASKLGIKKITRGPVLTQSSFLEEASRRPALSMPVLVGSIFGMTYSS